MDGYVDGEDNILLIFYWHFLTYFVSYLKLIMLMQASPSVVVDSEVYSLWDRIPMLKNHIRKFLKTVADQPSDVIDNYRSTSKILLNTVTAYVKLVEETINHELIHEDIESSEADLARARHNIHLMITNYRTCLSPLIDSNNYMVMKITGLKHDRRLFDMVIGSKIIENFGNPDYVSIIAGHYTEYLGSYELFNHYMGILNTAI
jgi:hypothetical protein